MALEALAESVGISPDRLASYEAELDAPDEALLVSMARALSVEPGDIRHQEDGLGVFPLSKDEQR